MIKFIHNFHSDEDGAVTVDWVVLTAAVVGLAIAAYTAIEEGASNLTQATSAFLGEQVPGGIGEPEEAEAPAEDEAPPPIEVEGEGEL